MAAPDLRDRLAELEVEHATLLAELRAFESDYLRRVGVIDVQVQELEARILALVFAQSGLDADRAAADAAEQRFRETTTALKSIPAPAGPPPTDDLKTAVPRRGQAHAPRPGRRRGRPRARRGVHEAPQLRPTRRATRRRSATSSASGRPSPYARGAPVGSGPAPALQAAVAHAEQRLAEARDSDLARLMEESLAATMAGRDLLAELREQAEIDLARARARLAELDT